MTRQLLALAPGICTAGVLLAAGCRPPTTAIASAEPPKTAAARVRVERTPDGGIQPQAMVGADGTVHLIYYKGSPPSGDLFYTRRRPGGGFSPPLRVNSQPGSAIAAGTIRGGQLALGKEGRPNVAWNGSGDARPTGPDGGSPMLYSRLNDAGAAFEQQRNLMQFTRLLDGGGTVAADPTGNVIVAWHAADGPSTDEGDRRLYVARSQDGGRTFARETPAWDQPTGACACCGAKAFADRAGGFTFLYRGAAARVHRSMFLLSAASPAGPFAGASIDPWVIDT